MENLKQLTLITVILLIIFYPLLILFAPIKIEIVPADKQMYARIYKRTMLNPFNNVFIPNVKRAITTTAKDSEGDIKYRVELEDFQGHRFPVTSYEASGYNSEASIEAKINNSIKNRTHLKYSISSHYSIMFILGIMIILVVILRLAYYKRYYWRKIAPHD